MNSKYCNLRVWLVWYILITFVALPMIVRASDDLALAKTAFLEDEAIITEIGNLKELGWKAGTVHVVPIVGFCGVAGCDSIALVSYLFDRENNGPNRKSIMATVQIREPGSIVVGVKRVSLQEIRTITFDPRVEGLVPIEPPTLRIIDRMAPGL